MEQRTTANCLLANVRRVVRTEVVAAQLEYVRAKLATVTAVEWIPPRAWRIAAIQNQMRSQFLWPLATVAPLDAAQSS